MPITVPQGVDVSIKEDQISVKGTGGTLFLTQNTLVKVTSEGGKLSFAPANESREANAMSGTMRQLVNNMVVGVTKGFEKKLTLIGVGYKAANDSEKVEHAERWGYLSALQRMKYGNAVLNSVDRSKVTPAQAELAEFMAREMTEEQRVMRAKLRDEHKRATRWES